MSNKLPIIGVELFDKFSAGDLVMWHRLTEDKTGIILDIFTKESGDRVFPFANVYIIGEDTRIDILLTNLVNIT